MFKLQIFPFLFFAVEVLLQHSPHRGFTAGFILMKCYACENPDGTNDTWNYLLQSEADFLKYFFERNKNSPGYLQSGEFRTFLFIYLFANKVWYHLSMPIELTRQNQVILVS